MLTNCTLLYIYIYIYIFFFFYYKIINALKKIRLTNNKTKVYDNNKTPA